MNRLVRSTVLVTLAAATLMVAAGPVGAAATDQQIAQQGVIVATDVPATWTASPRDDSGDQQSLKIAAKIPGCKGYVAFERANDATTSAESQNFSSGDDQIHNSSYVYPTDAEAAKTFKALGSSKATAACLTQTLRKAIDAEIGSDKSVKKVTVQIKPVSQRASSADVDATGFAGGYQIVLKDGSSQSISIALVAFRAGRAINTYSSQFAPDSSDITSVFQGAVAATLGRSIAAQA